MPQDGIIPIAHSQDTAGPITRTVTDAAIMLNAMRAPFGPVLGHALPADYTTFLGVEPSTEQGSVSTGATSRRSTSRSPS